jgi:hypothetical protein
MSTPQIEAVYDAQQRSKESKTDAVMPGIDPEFDALNTCAKAITGLSHEAKQRVLGYLLARFNVTPIKPTPVTR